MKKTTLVILAFFLSFMCCSCTQVIVNSADEIRLNKWSAETEYDKVITLDFNGDKGVFKVNSRDKKASLTISGLCIIDADKIAIFNEADNENYIFSYKLKGDKLTLKYSGGKLNLLRVKGNPSE